MKETIKLGCIGLGNRAINSLIPKTIMKMDRFRIVAVCDRVDVLVENACGKIGDSSVQCYTDHRKMLAEAGVDAVLVCVEPYNNASVVCDALASGKHVMCEVPLAYSIEDCWRIVLAVEKSGLKFQMAEQIRYSPHIQAWREMVADGRLGKIVYAEGQYLHGRNDDRYWMDSRTGQRISIEVARNNPNAVKSRAWGLEHPIMYLPHELSPILSVLGDRVKKVVCMGTRRKSYVHEWFPVSDVEVALMHTEKDTVLRLSAGFQIRTAFKESTGYHWYNLMGTRGSVETNRSNADNMKYWSVDEFMKEPAELMWEYNPATTPAEALASGHSGTDYHPWVAFADAIVNDVETGMNVYQAAEATAPAIMAARSMEQDSACLMIPEFRPGPNRKSGQEPCDISGGV